MANILVKELGEVSAVPSEALSQLEGRIETAEGAITSLETEVEEIRTDMGNVTAGEDILKKISVASGTKLANFVSGYYAIHNDIVDSTPTESTSGNYVCAVLAYEPGDIVRINLNIKNANSASMAVWAFTNADREILRNSNNGKYRSSGNKYDDYTIQHLPNVSAFLYVNTRIGDTSTQTTAPYTIVGNNSDDLDDRIDTLEAKTANMILAQDSEPSGIPENKLWFETTVSGNTYEIPTVEEMQTYVANQITEAIDGTIQHNEYTDADKQKVMNMKSAATLDYTETVSQAHIDDLPTSKAVMLYVNNALNNSLANLDLGSSANMDAEDHLDVDDSTTVPTRHAVKEYVDMKVDLAINGLGAAAQKDAATSISLETIGTGYVPTTSAVATYVTNSVTNARNTMQTTIGTAIDNLQLGSASRQEVASTLASSHGTNDHDHVPTAKAVVDYLGTAATKDTTSSISSESTVNEVPTGIAVYTFVTSGISAALISAHSDAVSTANTAANAAAGAVASDLDDLEDVVEDVSDDLTALDTAVTAFKNKSAVTEITSGSGTNFPTEGAVKTYADAGDAALQGSIDTISGNITTLGGRIDAADAEIRKINKQISAEKGSKKRTDGCISVADSPASSYSWLTTTGAHVCFPVEAGDAIEIFSHPVNGTRYAFLSSYTVTSATIYESIDMQSIDPDDTETVTVPSGANYLYVTLVDENWRDTEPVMLTINGIPEIMNANLTHEIDTLKRNSIGMRGNYGTLGEDDWEMDTGEYGVKIKRQGNTITVSGTYTGSNEMYVKITGNVALAFSSINNDFTGADEAWGRAVAGGNRQLQVAKNRNETSAASPVLPSFSCYGDVLVTDGLIDYREIRQLATRSTGDTSLAYNAAYVPSENVGKNNLFLVMRIPPLCASFGTESDPMVYTVWLEDKSDEVKQAAYNTEITAAVVNVQSMMGANTATATSTRNGLMTKEDKTKLDGFLPASAYVTKDEIQSSYVYKGTVADLTELLALEDVDVYDVYYVESETAMYTYYEGGWIESTPGGVYIDEISTNEIDALFT